jgi:hypothetical protein
VSLEGRYCPWKVGIAIRGQKTGILQGFRRRGRGVLQRIPPWKVGTVPGKSVSAQKTKAYETQGIAAILGVDGAADFPVQPRPSPAKTLPGIGQGRVPVILDFQNAKCLDF